MFMSDEALDGSETAEAHEHFWKISYTFLGQDRVTFWYCAKCRKQERFEIDFSK